MPEDCKQRTSLWLNSVICIMIKAGIYSQLRVDRMVDFGAYLEDEEGDAVLLPRRFIPEGTVIGQMLRVFVYHDSENRKIATTQTPYAIAGEIAKLKVLSVTPQGAFMDIGLMKDLFVPRSKQLMGMHPGGEYLVGLYIDEQTGRLAATEKIDFLLSNESLSVKEMDQVKMIVQRRTDLGYMMIINHKHTGLLHFNEIFRSLEPGDVVEGFIKKIHPGNTIDVVLGRPGYERVNDETSRILQLLEEHDGYLPYHDKSDPKEIYDFFGMSKKTFKMILGKLYKERKIELTKTGFRSSNEA